MQVEATALNHLFQEQYRKTLAGLLFCELLQNFDLVYLLQPSINNLTISKKHKELLESGLDSWMLKMDFMGSTVCWTTNHVAVNAGDVDAEAEPGSKGGVALL